MRILILPDMHIPYVCLTSLQKAKEFADHYNPDHIIQLGDFIDAKAWGRWPKDPDDLNAQDEWDKVMEQALEVAELFPKMTILSGNHDRRPMAKALEAGLPKQLIRRIDEVFNIPGWHFHLDSSPFVLDDTIFIHGDEMAGSPPQKAQKLGKNLVQGHTHKASLTYINTFQHQLFAMECGHIAEINSLAFRYSAKNPQTSWCGFATITDGLPALWPTGGRDA